MATCEAILLAEIIALLNNEHLHTDAIYCPGQTEHVVTVERPDRGVHLVIKVCSTHEALIAATVTGYQRSLKLRRRPSEALG